MAWRPASHWQPIETPPDGPSLKRNVSITQLRGLAAVPRLEVQAAIAKLPHKLGRQSYRCLSLWSVSARTMPTRVAGEGDPADRDASKCSDSAPISKSWAHRL